MASDAIVLPRQSCSEIWPWRPKKRSGNCNRGAIRFPNQVTTPGLSGNFPQRPGCQARTITDQCVLRQRLAACAAKKLNRKILPTMDNRRYSQVATATTMKAIEENVARRSWRGGSFLPGQRENRPPRNR